MKKRIALTLIVIMIATMAFAMLSACEFGINDNKHLGKYCKYEDGNYNTDVWIELSGNNIWTDGEKSGIYQIDGSSLTFLIDGIEIMSGTLSNGILTIKNGESEIVYKKYNRIVVPSKEYKVKFHLNYGDNEEIEKDTLNSVINFEPTRDGYSFDGWWTATIVDENAVLNSQWDVTAKVTDNELELWAKWSPIQYTITYHLNGGNWNIESKNQYTVEDSFNLDRPERAGYIFAGWYDNEQFGGNEIASIEEGNVGNKEFWAKWSITGYSVSYHLDGGINAVNNPSNYNINSSSIILDEASKIGYTFDGWYDNADFAGNAITQIDAGSIGNKELWAKWTLNEYTITYHLDGGINAVSNPSSYNVNSATVVLEEASKTGYTFCGWYDNAELTGNAITQIDEGSVGNKELWAKWTLNEYAITYHLDGGANSTNNPSTYNFDTPTIVLSEASKTGYTFDGWYDNADLTGNAITQIDEGSIGNKELWAKWSINQYTIDFDSNGGSEVASIVENYGTSITAPDQPTKVGYTFGGWYKDAALSVEYVFDTMGAENITLKAKWNAILYTIEYRNVEDAINTNPVGYYIDSETILLQPATKTGYIFGGWYKESALVNKVTLIEKGSVGNIVLYASWVKADDGYAIISAPNYSFLDDTTLKITLANDVEEYDFRGKFTVSANASWRVFTQSDCAQPSELTLRKTSSLSEGDNYFYVLVENQSTYDNRVYTLNLYKLHNYTVNYYGEGGKLLSTYQQMENTVLSQDDIPVDQDKIDQGYYIDQWFFDEEMTEEYDFVTPINKNQSVINLYAHYNTIVYDIVYHIDNPQDYNLTLEYTVESDDIVLPSSARAHYLLYWYEDENYLGEQVTKIGSGSMGEKHLYAKYVPIEYTITYHLDGGENDIANPSQYNVESEDITLEPATKTGYTFEGWYYDEAFTLSANTITTAMGEDLNVYAHFLPFESQIADGNITIVGYSGSDTEVVVPSTIYRWQVVSIGEGAFRNNSTMTSITIPDSVTSIGEDAFYGCSSLTNITIPDGVMIIGESAFRNCSSLTSIIIPNSVISIGYYAFYGCSSLESMTIPFVGATKDGSGNTYFGYIFGAGSYSYNSSYVSSSLTTVTITGVTSIGYGAFYGCSNLTSITIPNSVTSIGSRAFDGCSSLTSITIPDSVTSIGSRAFEGCSNLTSITIPDGVTSIGEYAFYDCRSLTSITIPNSVTSIGSGAFYGCSRLTSITIPDSVTNIGEYALCGCNSLTSVVIGNGVTSIGRYAFEDCSSLTSITIPDSVTSISDGLLSGCASLASLTIPFVGAEAGKTSSDTYQYPFGYIFGTSSYTGGEATEQYYYDNSTKTTPSVTYYIPSSLISVTVTGGNILYGAFYNCRYLINVEIGNKITEIGIQAFCNCSSLTSINIPNGVTRIGNRAFENCSSMTSIIIPSSVTSIGRGAFYGCSNLTSVNITDIDKWCAISFDGCTANPLYYAYNLCLNGEEVTDIIISDDVTSIGDYALYNCISLTSISIPDSVKSIGMEAFSGCSSLESMTIPFVGAMAGGIYKYPFGYIFGTTSYTGGVATEQSYYDVSTPNITSTTYYIPSSLKSVTVTGGNILYGAFYNCSNITRICLGNGVSSIDSYAFYGCSSIESMSIPFVGATKDGSSHTHFGYIFGADAWSTSSSYVPSSLKTVTITDGTSIGEVAFASCSSLTSITIPDGVTSIGDSAFSGCSSLTSFSIPDSVTSIGNRAFSNCSSLTSFSIPDSVTSIGEYAFYGCSSLTSITIPDSVTSIGSWAFRECSSLISITIPDSVTSIGNSLFYYCNSLASITIPFVGATKDGSSNTHFGYIFGASSYSSNSSKVPSSLKTVTITGGTSIGSSVFSGCSSLTSITIPDGVTSIGNSAFSNCSSLTSFSIPDSVTSIGDGAFSVCKSLTSITIPDNVTSIGSNAFSVCTGLISVHIGRSLNSIGYRAFNSCYSIIEMTVPFVGATRDGSVNTYFGYIFGEGDFFNYNSLVPKSLKSVLINGATSIGSNSFYGCSSLTSITLPDSVTSIGNRAFSNCSSLTSFSIPDSVTSIGEWAFSNCSSLTSITIPDRVTSIGSGAFGGCDLDNIYVDEGNDNYHVSGNCLIETINKLLVAGCDNSIIPIDGSVTSIGSGAFSGCSSLVSITIPDSVTSIGSYAFRNCSSLTSITIPDSVTSIGEWAFHNCSSLTSITIPDSVTSIGSYAFRNCSSLTSITIPNSVTSIGSHTFYECSSLTSITIPDSVTSIGDAAFYGCSSLTSINFQGTVDQWIAISKSATWDDLISTYTIYCTDGNIAKT